MPYFQRDRMTGAVLPVDTAAAATAVTTVASIVDKATAILDQQTTTSGTVGVPKADGPGPGVPLANLAGFADVQRRLSDGLADLLKLLALPEQAMPAPAATAVRVLSQTLSSVPMIESAGPVAAGSTAMIPVSLINDGADAANVVLYLTDFISDNGHQIPASEVKFSPRALSLGGHSQGKSTMQVPVPAQAVPGNYSALVQAMGLGRPCAVVVLRVE